MQDQGEKQRQKRAPARAPGAIHHRAEGLQERTSNIPARLDRMGETVQQRAGEAPRSEHPGPLVEREVGGHQDGAPLAALAEDLKEQFRAGAGERDESQFVDDQQVEPRQLPLQVQQAPLAPGLHEFVGPGRRRS